MRPAPGTLDSGRRQERRRHPGFRIRDTAGRQYLLKFDPLTNPELASAADVITSKFFYALGYNVPENYVVYFDRSRIAIGKDAQMKDAQGHKRAIRAEDVDEMLAKTPRAADGKYRAMASLLIKGKPLGPFKYDGTRGDDPNDLVAHETSPRPARAAHLLRLARPRRFQGAEHARRARRRTGHARDSSTT